VRNGSITRWRRCNNIYFPNIPGCIDINKVRNIHIYECDLNAILAIKWRNAIQKAEDEMKLCESQFESQKTQTFQLPMLIEILQQVSGNKLEPAFTKFKLLPDLTSGRQVTQSKPDHTKWSMWFKFLTNIVFQHRVRPQFEGQVRSQGYQYRGVFNLESRESSQV
jgi:hypothetical protein